MSVPIAVIFSDAHLDTHAWTNRPAIRGDSMLAYKFIGDYARNLGLSQICCGDFWDENKPSSEVVDFVRKDMNDLVSVDLSFFYIQGQHGLAKPPWLSATHSCPSHMHGATVELAGYNFYAIDWTPADKLQEELDKIPEDTDVLIMHQVWEEFMGTVTSCEGSLTQIPHAKVVFTGDYHVTSTVAGLVGATGQDMVVYSPGSTNMRSISEPPEKSFYVLHDDLSVENIPVLATREVLSFNLANLADFSRMAELIRPSVKKLGLSCPSWWPWRIGDPWPLLPEELRKPLIWVKYSDDIPDVVPSVKQLIGDLGHLFLKRIPNVDEEEVELKEEERQQVLERGLAGCLDLMVDKDSEHYLTLVRLLNSENPKLDLQQLKQERGL